MRKKLSQAIMVLETFVVLTLVAAAAGCSVGGGGIVAALPTLTAVTERPTRAVFTPESFELDPDLMIRQVGESVYIITHAFPWPANSMVVEMLDGTLVLVDTPYTPEATAAALEWFQNRLGERPIVAINTGYHYDNLGGNSYLIEQGIPVYGSDQTVELLAERGEVLRAKTLGMLDGAENQRFYESHANLEYLPPTRIFSAELGLELEVGGQTVMVVHPGPTHAPDNLIVYIPFQQVLFGGSMVVGEEYLGNLVEADREAWRESLDELAQFDYDILVPGHGERLDPGLLEHTLTLLAQAP